MPNVVIRVLLAGAALIAALLMSGFGMGVAAADPEDPTNPTDPGTGGDPPTSSEPEPTTGLPSTTPQPSIFDIPQTIATQLRDMFGKPLSIFGNGRVPGTLTTPDVPTEGASTGRNRDRPITGKIEPKTDLTPPSTAPSRRTISTVEVTLPFTPKITVPVPSVPVPGYETMRWSLNLTDPYAAYTSVGQTLSTVNSLLMDAYAPYDPFRPPAPKPQPTFRTMQEEPSVVDVDGTGGIVPLSNGSSGLPVLQAPVVVPPIRIAPPPRPIGGPPPRPIGGPPPRRSAARPPRREGPRGGFGGRSGSRAQGVRGPDRIDTDGADPARRIGVARPAWGPRPRGRDTRATCARRARTSWRWSRSRGWPH